MDNAVPYRMLQTCSRSTQENWPRKIFQQHVVYSSPEQEQRMFIISMNNCSMFVYLFVVKRTGSCLATEEFSYIRIFFNKLNSSHACVKCECRKVLYFLSSVCVYSSNECNLQYIVFVASNKIKLSSGAVAQVVEELDKVLALNSLLISLKNQPDAVRFAPGVGPISLLGKTWYSFLECC